MSSTSPSSHLNTQRSSRFVEGEPRTHSQSPTTNPLLASILSEQEQSESRLRSASRSRQGSNSSTASSQSQHTSSKETSPQASSLKRHRNTSVSLADTMTLKGTIGSPSGLAARGRSSLEDGRQKLDEGRQKLETTGGKIVGRLRALTTSQNGLEQKIQTGKVVPYPGT
jgi:hypothetical protein